MEFSKLCLSLVCSLCITLSATSQTWPIQQTDDANHWNNISATFGEIHPTGNDHYHGAIDINIETLNCPFYPVEDGWAFLIGNTFMSVEHEWPLNTNNRNRRSRYGHVLTTVSNSQPVTTGTQLGTVSFSPIYAFSLHLTNIQWIFANT